MRKMLCALTMGLAVAGIAHAAQPILGTRGNGMYVPSRNQDECWGLEPNLDGQLLGSEVIGEFGLISETANDLVLADSADICVIRWWGGYFNYAPGDTGLATSFHVRIYGDDDCGPTSEIVFEREFLIDVDCSEKLVHVQGDPYRPIYEYDAFHRFKLPGGHYWLSVQAGDHGFPPQWGRLAAATIDSCGSVYKSEYFSFPDWTAVADIGYPSYEASQALVCAPCPPRIRACCLPDSLCRMELPMACVTAGGIPLGPGTVCDPYPCPESPTIGACCVPDADTVFFNTCEIRSRASCDSAAGRWDGAGICTPNPCPPDSVGTPCPPDGVDYFPNAYAVFLFDLPGDGLGRRPVLASGPVTVVRRGRDIEGSGKCSIETEIIQLDMAGGFNPNCFDPLYGRQATITLANEPDPASLGTFESSDEDGNPAWPVVSTFAAHLMVEITGQQYPDSVLQLVSILDFSDTLQTGNLWGQQRCLLPSDAFTVPSDDHFYIPCDVGIAGKDAPRTDSLGCCLGSHGVMFLTYPRICQLLHGLYSGLAQDCDSCLTESITDHGGLGESLIGIIRPNPSSGTVRISYMLSADTTPQIELFDAAGRAVRRFAPGKQAAGSYELVWDGRNEKGREVAAGVYFIRVRAGDAKATRGIVLMR